MNGIRAFVGFAVNLLRLGLPCGGLLLFRSITSFLWPKVALMNLITFKRPTLFATCERVHVAFDKGAVLYQGTCTAQDRNGETCGWIGPKRLGQQAANRDTETHLHDKHTDEGKQEGF
jgi:hypothetical protein